MIKRIKKVKGSYTVFLKGGNGIPPTNKEILDYCVEKIEKIENNPDYKLLVELYKKIKTKYDNKEKELEVYRTIRHYLLLNPNSLDKRWGEE